MSDVKNGKRNNLNIELLRVICCYCVVAMHTYMHHRLLGDGVSIDVSILILEAFCRCAVPCFLMITGYFAFQREKSLAFCIRYILTKILPPTLAVLFLCNLLNSFICGEESLLSCLSAAHFDFANFLHVLRYPGKQGLNAFHLWYMFSLLKVYLLLPLLQLICENDERSNKARRYLMLILALIFLVKGNFDAAVGGSYFVLPFGMNDWEVLYVLLGYELRLWFEQHGKSMKTALTGAAMLLAGAFSTIGATLIFDIGADGVYDEFFLEPTAIGGFLSAVGTFLLIQAMPLSSGRGEETQKAQKASPGAVWSCLVSFSGSLTFSAYLLHLPLLLILWNRGLDDWMISAVKIKALGVFVCTILYFLLAMSAAFLWKAIRQLPRRIVVKSALGLFAVSVFWGIGFETVRAQELPAASAQQKTVTDTVVDSQQKKDAESAADPVKIRVGFFPMDGYYAKDENGNLSGMGIEFMEELNVFLEADIQYVMCEDWADALTKLRSHQIDLLGTAQLSEEREKLFDFTEISTGYTFGVVATTMESTLAYEDFTALKDAKFGIVHGYIRAKEFFDYMTEHGVRNPKVMYYSDLVEMKSDLAEGKLDAIVHTFTEIDENMRIIGQFAPRPYYFMTFKGNAPILDRVDKALVAMKLQKPSLDVDLMNKYYFSRYDHRVVFTSEEKNYAERVHTLNIGYLDGFYPFSYQKGGELKGILRSVGEQIGDSVGWEIAFTPCPNAEAAIDALKKGEIDVLGYNALTDEVLEANHLSKTIAYAGAPLVLVEKKALKNEEIRTISTIGSLESEARAGLDMSNRQLQFYASQADAMLAVLQTLTDAAVCDGYLAEYLLGVESSYEGLEIRSILPTNHEIGMVYNVDNSRELGPILAKIMVPISPQQISEYILADNPYKSTTLVQFMRLYGVQVNIAIMILVLGAALITLFLIRSRIRVQKLLYMDYQFDVWNLNYLSYQVNRHLDTSLKDKHCIMAINVERFRVFNSIHGWEHGQKLLGCMIETLRTETTRGRDFFAREHDDRFIVFLSYQEMTDLSIRIETLREKLEKKIHETVGSHMDISIGVAFLEGENIDVDNTIARANLALAAASTEKTRVKYYDGEFSLKMKENEEREQILKKVDIHSAIVAFYQAKVDIRTNRIVGAEALARMHDPQQPGAYKAPWYFVPFYERIGRVMELDFAVMEETCKMLESRITEGKPVVPISCNFSRQHFMRKGFTVKFLSILEKYSIPKSLIEIEITETLVVDELEQNRVLSTIRELTEEGIRLSIDDFGSGYSSLGTFEKIPASVIKLDRSFLLNKEDRGRQLAIMKGIVTMGAELGAQVVCEGVESADDIEVMKAIGAHVAQGYLYSRPIPREEFELHVDKGILEPGT